MTTRRQFIELVAALGGYSAAFASLRALALTGDVPPGAAFAIPHAPAPTRVAILGAGIAGLVAAFELREAGYDVTVLEARERVGGRNWTVRRGTRIDMTDGTTQKCDFSDGEYFNAGPARLPSHHDRVLGYCRRFGVALEPEVNLSRSAFLSSPKVNGGKPFRMRQAVADTRGHVAELLGKAIHRGRLDDQLSTDDRERMVEFLRFYGDLDRYYEYRGSERAGFKVTPGAFDRKGVAVDPLSMHELLDADLWLALMFDEFVEWQATMLQPVGGMDHIPQAFATRLGDRILLGREVVEIRNGERGVEIVHQGREPGSVATLAADYAIVTLPFSLLAGVRSNLPSNVKEAIARVKYDHALKVAFEAPRFWEAQQIYGGISYVKNDAGIIWYPSHGFHAERGIVVGAYAVGESAKRIGEQPLAARIDVARQSIEQVHPGCAQHLGQAVNVAWNKIPYSLGPWARPWEPREGSNEEHNEPADFRLLNAACDRVYFASANLSQIPGWQEGAALSAQRAVGLLAERVTGG